MNLTLIAAISENNVIGIEEEAGSKIPWRIPEDMARFRGLTIGHPVIMGRKTYASIPKKFRPLPERENIVVTRDNEFKFQGIIIAHSIEEALELAVKYNPPTYVIGGQQIYEQTIDLAQRLEITRVHGDYEGNRFFPSVDWEEWELLSQERITSKIGIECSFLSYSRKQ